jgi:hypothetical protein
MTTVSVVGDIRLIHDQALTHIRQWFGQEKKHALMQGVPQEIAEQLTTNDDQSCSFTAALSLCVLFYSSALHRAAGRRGFMIDLQRCAGGWRGFVIDVQSAEECSPKKSAEERRGAQTEEDRRGAQRGADRRRAHTAKLLQMALSAADAGVGSGDQDAAIHDGLANRGRRKKVGAGGARAGAGRKKAAESADD